MSYLYSSALAHLQLAGVTSVCLRNYSLKVDNFTFSHGMYYFIIIYSLMGIWRWGNPGHGTKAVKIYNFLMYLQSLFTLPLFTSSMWLKIYQNQEAAYFHIFTSLIVFVFHFRKKKLGDLLLLTSNVFNCLLLLVICFLSKKYWGITASISYFIAFFVVKERIRDLEIPTQDLYNYSLSFFVYFTLRSLKQ